VSAPTAYVHADLRGTTHRVGRLWVATARGRESATFDYEPDWLASDERFALDPALQLYPGPFHTRVGQALFGAMGDSAPDRWGRTLLARAERRRAREENRAPRAMREIDYLLGVTDETRQGALRFSKEEEDGPFLAETAGIAIPPIVELPRLLTAASNVLDDEETAEDLRLLLAPGSSLGGARPKASVRDRDGTLLIAKFPARSDAYSVVRWEAVALSLARQAGIEVADARIELVLDRPVLLVRRFDRVNGHRIPFLSAMSALDADDRDVRSYLDIADALRPYGAAVAKDLAALWRRVVFNVLISNTDDHLRNHAFVYAGRDGWRLSPAYDLNPVPTDVKPRLLSTAITEDLDVTASLELALETAAYFGVTADAARMGVAEVFAAVRGWRKEAARFGIGAAEIERMSTAFEHEDAVAAGTM
jgi:serine/threonine-protein kinase HipA